ncbi:Equilibrative nucleoside transporter [Dillenia turbinata]|uniref:Equilibrative nucleoside transporter n=1 Tax=Dillenia turbinata TaxID=194707 RepID=A0AAN8W2X1_9MAGN
MWTSLPKFWNHRSPHSKKVQTMETDKGSKDQSKPRDTYKAAYLIHFLLGAGNLLPWNSFITAVDYFGFLYPTKHVEKVFSVAYMSSSLLCLILLLSCFNKTQKLGLRLRLNLGFSMFILSLMAPPVIDWCHWHGTNGAFTVTIASVVVCGFADALVAASLMGSAGELPKQYMQGISAGYASSGVLVSILRIITKASLPQSPQGLQTSAHLYFMVSTTILLGCIICGNILQNLPVMQQHHKLQQANLPSSKPEFWNVAKRIKWPAFGVFIIYIVTLSIFPGFIAENLKSELLQDWYPILLIATYNVADLVGRCLTAAYAVQSIGKATFGSVARLLFYPLFTAFLHGPTWLKSEVPMVSLTFVLGLTNGYLTTVLMILTPKSVPVEEAEIAAVVMVVFLGLGLVGGSILGWFWII